MHIFIETPIKRTMYLLKLLKELNCIFWLYTIGLFINAILVYLFYKEFIYFLCVDLMGANEVLIFQGLTDFFAFVINSILCWNINWLFTFYLYINFIFLNKTFVIFKNQWLFYLLLSYIFISFLILIKLNPLVLKSLLSFLNISQINLKNIQLSLLLPASHLMHIYFLLVLFSLLMDFFFYCLILLPITTFFNLIKNNKLRLYLNIVLVSIVLTLGPPDIITHLFLIINAFIFLECKIFIFLIYLFISENPPLCQKS